MTSSDRRDFLKNAAAAALTRGIFTGPVRTVDHLHTLRSRVSIG